MSGTMKFGIAVLVAFMSWVVLASPQSQPEFPCYTIHARYMFYTGDGVRELWPIGSHRKLWVEAGDEELMHKLGLDHPEKDALYGDFSVCPLEADKPGVMRHVRIASWNHLRYGPAPRR
jgi:hypothetical protein